MKQKIKNILQDSFYQLLIIYTLVILAIGLGFLSKFTLHFEIFAVILAFLGISIIHKIEDKKTSKRTHYLLFVLAIFLIIFFRFIPYISNSIPLGYDAGLYKYGIESGLKNLDVWILNGGMEPGFLYLMSLFKFLPTNFILILLFILFNVLLGISIYLFTKEYFGDKTALISILIYSVSVIQFKVFTYMYYKNIIGLALMLFAFYFLKKQGRYSRILFVILSGLVGAIHRPTFYILGLSYFLYALITPYQSKKYNFKELRNNVINGILILLIAGLFYIGKFLPAITTILPWVAEGFVNPGTAPGAFISLFSYQFLTLTYLPFAILGFFYLIKQKKFNILFFWTVINASIVYFQFFFFNRFIIHLDIALIILASVGFSILINYKKRLGIFVLIVLLFSSGFITWNESLDAKPFVSQEQLDLIKELNNIEQNASVMAISSEYSPYVLAYSGRRTIAPGLFDYDSWTEEQWNLFWKTDNKQETISLVSLYKKPLYLFAGSKSFNNPCFSVYLEKNNNKIYKYNC